MFDPDTGSCESAMRQLTSRIAPFRRDIVDNGVGAASSPTSQANIPKASRMHEYSRSLTSTFRRQAIFPICVTAAGIVLLVVLRDDGTTTHVITACLLLWVFQVAYFFSRLKVNPAAYLLPALFVWAEFTTLFAVPFFYLFRNILPGTVSSDPNLLQTFFGSGLMEELMKSLPALLGLYLARRTADSGGPAAGFFDALRCSTPMKGMMIGFAAGVGFVYVDVCYHVIASSGIYVLNIEYPHIDLGEFQRLSQRILSGVVSHVFWTSSAGFFIGLAAKSSRYLIASLLTAWLLPAALHTFWNMASYVGNDGRWLKVVISLAVFAGCFVGAWRDQHMSAARTSEPQA